MKKLTISYNRLLKNKQNKSKASKKLNSNKTKSMSSLIQYKIINKTTT